MALFLCAKKFFLQNFVIFAKLFAIFLQNAQNILKTIDKIGKTTAKKIGFGGQQHSVDKKPARQLL